MIIWGREMNMAILIRGGEVYSPDPLGPKDILVAGGRIEAVSEPGAIALRGADVHEIDASGRSILPGFVDGHVHILGGGGEGGPATRAPEIAIEDIAASGVTSLIGCLGTDGVTRSMAALLAKARALEIEGVSTYIFSGSYEIPVNTLTGSVRSDLILIEKAIGAGEIAISDHRSSQPTFEEIARLAAECRVGGLLGGKAGVLHLHLGGGARGLQFLFRLLKETEIPASQVMPTHVNRNRRLLDEGIAWVLAGGYADFTAGTPVEEESEDDISVETAVRLTLAAGAPLERLTVTSDANGSLPVFDALGRLTGLTIATERSLLEAFRSLVRRGILSLADAARLFAANPARFYKLAGKGEIRPGGDADLILFDKDLGLTDVCARGRLLMERGKLLARGTFAK
jgi:beta-aspartyl-dipeptidase (metallo-type)